MNKIREKYGQAGDTKPATTNPSVDTTPVSQFSPISNNTNASNQNTQNTQNNFKINNPTSFAESNPINSKWAHVKLDQNIINYVGNYNSSKQLIRPTTDAFPITKLVAQKNPSFPLGAIIQPNIDEGEVPMVNFGQYTIPRCEKCRAYMNPYTKFKENGHKVVCNLCKYTDNVLQFYYSPCTTDDIRDDIQKRNELLYGTVEYKAGTDYMQRAPPPPAFVFLFDVTPKAIKTGVIQMAIAAIKDLIEKKQFISGHGFERLQIAIILIDNQVSFVSFKNNGTIIVLNEFDILPVPLNYVLINVSENQNAILTFLDSLSQMTEKKVELKPSASIPMLAGIKIANKILSGIGGKIIMVNSQGGQAIDGALQIKNLQEITNFYTINSALIANMTPGMQSSFITIDLFQISDKSENQNLLHLCDFIRYLGGDIYYYPPSDDRAQNFFYEFYQNLAKVIPLEAVFRVRCSQGWEVVKVYGHYSIKSNDLLSVSSMDENKTLIYEFRPTEAFNPEDQIFYIQTAFLFTTVNGERRIRVGNYGIPLTSCWNEIINFSDQNVMFYFSVRKGLYNFFLNPWSLSNFRNFILNAILDILNGCKSLTKSEFGNALPDSISMIPYYLLGFLKYLPFSPFHKLDAADNTNVNRIRFNYLPIEQFQQEIVPFLFSVDDLNDSSCFYDESGAFIYPEGLSLKLESIDSKKIYLMDIGTRIILFIGKNVNSSFIQDLIGSEFVPENVGEESLFSNMSEKFVEKLSTLINFLKSKKPSRYAPVSIVAQGSSVPLEMEFYYHLIEDQFDYVGGFPISYADFYTKTLKLA